MDKIRPYVEKSTYLEIPRNSRREFGDARFPGIPGNSRTEISGGRSGLE